MNAPRPPRRRLHLPVLVALVVGLLGAGPVRKGPGKLRPGRPATGMKDPSIPVSAIEALKQGQLARAWRFADGHLQRQPRGRAGHAVMGGIESRMGWAVESIDAFDAGEGARWYGSVGRILHANALRAVGRGDEAVALRRDDLRSDLEGVRLRTWVAMIDDLRAAGDPLGAEAILAEGMAETPRSTVLMSVAADLALDAGDIEGAEAWLALVQHYAGPVRRTRHVILRIAVLEQDHEQVDTVSAALLRVQPGDPVAIAALAHSLIDRGDPDGAWAVLQGVEARRRGDAALLVEQARALHAFGETADARALVGFVRARHPLDLDAQRVEAALLR